ncbi:MAG TPA: 3-phosphoshikimate 1-carboxyvinyltransferase [Gemmatimonadaceae bacterium]|jgi:3-phosphoshikimate 1-carboxyvinyltransferase|nr:3-phosphoshikimate 1-carboxyvinyltransferase [Gemmatimonadaceae bacterium]
MRVRGTLRVPGDKSISHRSLILGALGEGPSRITSILQSADVQSTAGVLRALGADVPPLSADFTVTGVGRGAFRQPGTNLDCGNSGTTTRLMAGVVAALPVRAAFVGDASLSRRPMGRVARPLEAMGARVELPPHHGLPMIVRGGSLHDVDWTTDVASAQIKSAILLAALVSGVRARVVEPATSRDHTERMLSARGVHLDIDNTAVVIAPGSRVRGLDVDVPGDPSSAAFFAGLAALAESGAIRLDHVCVNETRVGFITQLRRMGVCIAEENRRREGGEWVADLVVSPGALHGATVTERDVPSMIDELPLLACLATRADGETVITGANELRVKESDRIAAVVDNLTAIGAEAEELPDGMRIIGSRAPLAGRVVTHGDHRLAMAFGVLGAACGGSVVVDDPDCVSVSYPGFWADLARSHTP